MCVPDVDNFLFRLLFLECGSVTLQKHHDLWTSQDELDEKITRKFIQENQQTVNLHNMIDKSVNSVWNGFRVTKGLLYKVQIYAHFKAVPVYVLSTNP